MSAQPLISVIIVGYNMARELPRTVESFLPPYQRGFEPGDIEVIVIENGSPQPVHPAVRALWPDSVRYHVPEDPKPSPVFALNEGARMARAPVLCPVIDGARMASPGLLRAGLDAMDIFPDRFLIMPSVHLGPERQSISAAKGYEQRSEDRLLDKIHWPYEPYRLFQISAAAGSAPSAWYSPIAECNSPIVPAARYAAIGGYDERFDTPGGALANLDFFDRMAANYDHRALMLLGEATFHQFHGGKTTSKGVSDLSEPGRTVWDDYNDQFEAITGYRYVAPPTMDTVLYGKLPNEARGFSSRMLDWQQ